jgi:site-specific DNA recombinase
MTRHAIGYARVSTSDQADSGLSLDHQEQKIRAMADMRDVQLLEVIVDAGVSAKTLDRPGIQRALAMIDAGSVDAIIVLKLDRLTRSVRDLGEVIERIERRDVALMSVYEYIDSSTANGRLMLNMLGSIAQWEREAISERTADALRAKRARGERSGAEPFGFRVNGDRRTLHPYPPEQAIIRAIHDGRKAGYSLQDVADDLNRRGLRTRGGSTWRPQNVHGILRTMKRHEQETTGNGRQPEVTA